MKLIGLVDFIIFRSLYRLFLEDFNSFKNFRPLKLMKYSTKGFVIVDTYLGIHSALLTDERAIIQPVSLARFTSFF